MADLDVMRGASPPYFYEHFKINYFEGYIYYHNCVIATAFYFLGLVYGKNSISLLQCESKMFLLTNYPIPHSFGIVKTSNISQV